MLGDIRKNTSFVKVASDVLEITAKELFVIGLGQDVQALISPVQRQYGVFTRGTGTRALEKLAANLRT
jgi:hypothetical protein